MEKRSRLSRCSFQASVVFFFKLKLELRGIGGQNGKTDKAFIRHTLELTDVYRSFKTYNC